MHSQYAFLRKHPELSWWNTTAQLVDEREDELWAALELSWRAPRAEMDEQAWLAGDTAEIDYLGDTASFHGGSVVVALTEPAMEREDMSGWEVCED